MFFYVKRGHRAFSRQARLHLQLKDDKRLKSLIDEAISQGRNAENQIATDHLPLVREVARRLFRKNKLFVSNFEDLISAGEEGLVKAIHHYRGARRNGLRTRFAPYAAWLIFDSVSKAVRDQRWAIGIPSQIHRRIMTFIKARHKLHDALRRAPTIEELRCSLNLPHKVVTQLIAWVSPQCTSIETPVGTDGKSKLGDLLIDRSISPPNMSAELTVLHDGFGRLLSALPERERTIIVGRYGLDGKGQRTQEELAKQYHLTRQGVGLIEEKALEKMRRSMGCSLKLTRRQRTGAKERTKTSSERSLG